MKEVSSMSTDQLDQLGRAIGGLSPVKLASVLTGVLCAVHPQSGPLPVTSRLCDVISYLESLGRGEVDAYGHKHVRHELVR